jgi:hypothetical protein
MAVFVKSILDPIGGIEEPITARMRGGQEFWTISCDNVHQATSEAFEFQGLRSR